METILFVPSQVRLSHILCGGNSENRPLYLATFQQQQQQSIARQKKRKLLTESMFGFVRQRSLRYVRQRRPRTEVYGRVSCVWIFSKPSTQSRIQCSVRQRRRKRGVKKWNQKRKNKKRKRRKSLLSSKESKGQRLRPT